MVEVVAEVELWLVGLLAAGVLLCALFDAAALLGLVDSDTGSWALVVLAALHLVALFVYFSSAVLGPDCVGPNFLHGIIKLCSKALIIILLAVHCWYTAAVKQLLRVSVEPSKYNSSSI
ncbi:hypothetical protein B0H14DRAFT_2576395 [Mycena olivaceomarginata]|nr:hypothetical protein B0H14DRAFT_2576395 [Mycena olivaceomarginata]